MSDGERDLVTLSSLRKIPGWRERPAGTELLWEDGADEGTPHGYDLLDRGAFVRGYLTAPADWATIVDFYRQRLGRLGWTERSATTGSTAMVTFDGRPGESVSVIERPQRPHMWAPPGAYERPGTVYEVYVSVERPPADASRRVPDAPSPE
ncbi:MAG: hypothetical protein ABI635_02335 [Actinomycetota bacterium]